MKNRLNIITITILSLLLTITLLPLSIHAEETSLEPKEPDVSVFATKQQMMDDTFKPKNVLYQTIGTIIFGKNSQGEAQEWYILGNDSGVNDGKDNTVILAKAPIIKEMEFYDLSDQEQVLIDADTKWLVKSSNYKDCIYPEDISRNFNDDSGIGINHYGTSDVRDELKKITNSSDKGYFTTEELKIMNSTIITTEDIFNNTSYTTEDKLYLPYKSTENQTTMKIGSDNQITIDYGDYEISYSYWLRSPDIENYRYVVNIGLSLLYDVVEITNYAYVHTSEKQYNHNEEILTRKIGVVPVGNLDLTNVLFASAAKYGEVGELANDAPMTLRFDGSNKNIGNISYDNDNIYVAPSGEVTLFVQGRNGDHNWIYSVDLAGASLCVTKEDIIKDSNSNLSYLSASDIDLSKCKIWIEDKIDGLIYAVEAKKAINSVDITIDTPIASNPLATNATCNTTGVDTTKTKVTWDPASETVDYFKTYEASITLTPETGYVFVNLNTVAGLIKASATVNGKTAKSVTGNTDGTLTITYDFVVKDKIEYIKQPTLTYENGTIIDESKFPDKVKVTGFSDKEYELAVGTWAAYPANNYDPKRKDEQTLIYWTSLKEIPAELDYRNPDGPDVKLTITVKAAKTDSNTNGNHTVIIPDTSVK